MDRNFKKLSLVLLLNLCIFGSVLCEFQLHEIDIIDLPCILNRDNLSDYPNNDVSVDIVWWVRVPELVILLNEVHIEVQGGDFILISPHPIPPGINNASSAEEWVDEMPLKDSTLFTGDVNPDRLPLTYRLRAPEHEPGVFIYFHGHGMYGRNGLKESLNETYSTTTTNKPGKKKHKKNDVLPDLGFEIELAIELESDDNTTALPPISTLPPDADQFLIRFVYGKTPTEFLEEYNDLKEFLAEIASEFAEVQVNVTDIWLESFFCDPSWDEYSHCVQIKLAILTRNEEGNFIFTHQKLVEFWNFYRMQLEEQGLTTLNKEFDAYEMNKTTLWVTVFFGALLVSTLSVCFIWIRYQHAETSDKKLAESISSAVDGDPDRRSSGSSFAQTQGPTQRLFAMIRDRKEKVNYIEMDTNAPQRFQENAIFKKETLFEEDEDEEEENHFNRGFVDDEMDMIDLEDDGEPIPSTSQQSRQRHIVQAFNSSNAKGFNQSTQLPKPPSPFLNNSIGDDLY